MKKKRKKKKKKKKVKDQKELSQKIAIPLVPDFPVAKKRKVKRKERRSGGVVGFEE